MFWNVPCTRFFSEAPEQRRGADGIRLCELSSEIWSPLWLCDASDDEDDEDDDMVPVAGVAGVAV